ncbi:VOC family protein [Luteolibacter yonseiensis]|uniref:VOC family protein n=1 Tax=Luteolibacter yonseiensis TaxID=1144680 RepID=A0A934R3K6_9BACT|nr:VOC family protein [Luteolibacter yonseiensis]MBK1815656.1 VOC family protein [Luteolibacter yonseiensis]
MKIEHVAFNVADPVAVADWYVRHLGLRIVRHLPSPTQTHFLADDTGATVLEIYCNPPDQIPDYAAMNPLLFHLAFVSASPDDDRARLTDAGASFVDELKLPDGSHLVMLRDPWGVALQLCKRAVPLVVFP